MIKEKYKQLCLARQFGGINTIEFTQSLAVIHHITFQTIYLGKKILVQVKCDFSEFLRIIS